MRSILQEGTLIRLSSEGEVYKITGKPLGEGGGSIVYPCKKLTFINGTVTSSQIDYALKECFPLSSSFVFDRNKNGEVTAPADNPAAISYLNSVKKMQMREQEITGKIYNTSARTLPVITGSEKIYISFDDGLTFHLINNTVTVMTSFESKGKALKYYIAQKNNFSVTQAFQIIKQLLFAVKEVHEAGFLHLDIQDGNVFIKGNLSKDDNFVSLVDFGSSRQILEDGLCDTISDRVLFSTDGFAAPEIANGNDGTLRLGIEADLYSIGYLLLLMLTGKRYSQRELTSVNISLYLPKRKLKKLNCPPHMADKVHQIISRALKNSPQDRYHSCEEMLEDVSDLLHALQPYQSDLSQVVYDAFICYRHEETDSIAAKILQQKLEHFRIPRAYKNKSRKIKRVFLDEGELSSCSDFGLQVREALKNSGWLIVICSPQTKDSPWVNLEIKTFLEFHDRSRILAVITEGEPEDVFPDELLGNTLESEVLAADARGRTSRQIFRNIKKDVLLKIAAPILGITYDSLKQRKRNYTIKKYAVIMSAFLLMANLLLLFTINWNLKIKEQYQQNKKIMAENQVELSSSLLDSGDREGALRAALSVQWEDNEDTPVIPEQMYALNSALYSYNHSTENIEGFHPDRQIELEHATTDVCEFSPDNSIFFCLDKEGIAYFYNTVDWSLQWKCRLNSETVEESDKEYNIFTDGIFVSDQKILLFSSSFIYDVDITEKRCLKIIHPTNTFDSNYFIDDYAYHNGLLAVWYGDSIYLYDVENDTWKLLPLEIPTLSFGSSFAFSPDNTFLAVNFDCHYPLWGQFRDTSGIVIIDLKTYEKRTFSADYVTYLCFISEQQLASIEYQYVNTGTSEDANKANYFEVIYDVNKGEVWRNDTHYLRSTQSYSLTNNLAHNATVCQNFEHCAEVTSDVVIFNMNAQLLVIDKNTYQILIDYTFAYPIVSLYPYDNNTLLVGLLDGSVLKFRYEYRETLYSVNNIVNGFLYLPDTKTLVQPKSETQFIVISGLVKDESMSRSSLESIKTEKTESEKVDGTVTEKYAVFHNNSIDVYDGKNQKPFLQIPYTETEEPLLAFFRNDEQLIVYNQYNNIQIWDLNSNSRLTTKAVDIDFYYKTNILTDPEGQYFALYTSEGVAAVDSINDWLCRELNIYYVDDDSQIHPYADIFKAYVDFDKKLVYTFDQGDNIYYSSPLYEYKDLKEKANQILNVNVNSSSQETTIIPIK